MSEPCYLRTQRSPAFAAFYERVYGKNLNQYGTADMEQIRLLLASCACSPARRSSTPAAAPARRPSTWPV